MPTFKLDGQDIPFESGDTIIRAAWREGVEIPHYCWHPGLSVAANCRMCLVEIRSGRQMALPILKWDEKKKEYVPATKPKLQPACQITASEDMEVYAKSDHALKAQETTQEFLLLNHPIDCPICDQAGECKLQDYWLTSQRKLKRKKTERVHKPKTVSFGPTIVYDAERCIMCTRCIRFCDEVAKDHVLDMRERGNTNEIVVSQGRELDNDYTLMTEHVCPVGALTSKDFRFKARVWFLKSSPGVCTGCATGCNTWVDHDPRYQRVYRLRPRDNPEVNQYWMCDDGMMTYKRFHEDRIITGRVRTPSRAGDKIDEITRAESVVAAARTLRSAGSKAAVVLSAQHSSEDNFVLVQLARELFETDRFYLSARADWKGDDILRNADANPNRAGAQAVCPSKPESLAQLVKDVAAGDVDAVLSLGPASDVELGSLTGWHVNLTANAGPLTSKATVVVPVATPAECSGTFVNAEGHAAHFKKAITAPGGIEPAWLTLVEIGRELGWKPNFERLGQVRAAMPKALPAGDATEDTAAAPA